MSEMEEEGQGRRASRGSAGRQPLVVRGTDNDFQCEVLEKLARLEARMEMLMGAGQPGRMTLVENRVTALEHNDASHSLYERILNAVIATGISAAIAWHDRLRIK
ncbi:MAG: hypothetical protein ACLP6G_03615 [Terriglobales bacterium]